MSCHEHTKLVSIHNLYRYNSSSVYVSVVDDCYVYMPEEVVQALHVLLTNNNVNKSYLDENQTYFKSYQEQTRFWTWSKDDLQTLVNDVTNVLIKHSQSKVTSSQLTLHYTNFFLLHLTLRADVDITNYTHVLKSYTMK